MYVNIKNRVNGYYLRWYHEGWASWFFKGDEETITTRGEICKTTAGYSLTLGDDSLTRQQLYAISGLLKAIYVQLLTSDGWKACTVEINSLSFGRDDNTGGSVQFTLRVWAKTGQYTPIVLPDIKPANPGIYITESMGIFNVDIGIPSEVQTYAVRGIYLTDNLVITAPEGFEINEGKDSNYYHELSFTPIGGDVIKTINVRANASAIMNTEKKIGHVSLGADTKYVTLLYSVAIRFGLLYNMYAINTGVVSAANQALGWYAANQVAWFWLYNYIKDEMAAGRIIAIGEGGVLKETGYANWLETNIGAIDAIDFALRGAGRRSVNIGNSYSAYKTFAYMGTGEIFEGKQAIFRAAYNNANFSRTSITGDEGKHGYSYRLCRPATIQEMTFLDDGQESSPYIGNDGKVYPTIFIGHNSESPMVFIKHNLAETIYGDGTTPIPIVEDDATWAALETGACCAYGNDYDNVPMETP